MITVEKLEKGTYFDDAFKISFRYDPTTVAKVKELAERRYLPEDRAWEIPAHELPALIEKVGLSNIKSEEAVVQALNTKEIEDKREATQERLKGIKPVRDFDFKTAPLPHQIEAFNYGMEKNSLLIGDEQGLGKTKESIDICVARKKELIKTLIVCGVNSVKYNWEKEIQIHSNEGCVMVDGKTMDVRVQQLNDWYRGSSYFGIINIESLRNEKIQDALYLGIKDGYIGAIIVDEIHKAKNGGSQQGKALRFLKAPVKIGLSGTPMNKAEDLWNILTWLGVERRSFYSFRNAYCTMGGFGGYKVIGYKNLDSGNVYGWDKKDGKYYINPEQAKVRRLMCEGIMARKGSTLIAKELNDAGYRNTVGKPWKPMDIPKFVYDCKNVGTMIINKERHDFESKQTIKLPKEEWVYVENALPPIVTQEEWDLICKIHEERVIATGSDRRGKKTSGYSFSGKLVCGICGAPYWRKQRVSKDEYWVCSTKQTKGRRTRKRDSTMGKAGEINPLGCDNENISYNSLMEIMGVVSERLQANTDTIKQDMINWLTKLRKQLLEANGGHTEADLQRELSRKSKLLDAYLDGILNKQEYQKKAEELDERIIQLKAETEKNKANSGDIAEIDKVLANIDEEVSRYVDGNEKLKVEYLLEHLEQVQIFPDKVIVIVPILSEGIVVEKAQYVSREKRKWKDNTD